MKRSTAIRHLVELADVASDGLRLITTEIGWPLAAVGHGALLDPVDELEHGPEDQLWRAATAVTEIEAALDEHSR